MNKIFKEELFAPKKVVSIEYTGQNPFKFYGSIQKLLINTFRVEGKDISETDFEWDLSGAAPEFLVKMSIKVGLDAYSSLKIIIQMHGRQSTKDFPGNLTLKFMATISSEFYCSTYLHEGILVLYKKFFYDKLIEKYKEENKRNSYIFLNGIRKILKVKEVEI